MTESYCALWQHCVDSRAGGRRCWSISEVIVLMDNVLLMPPHVATA